MAAAEQLPLPLWSISEVIAMDKLVRLATSLGHTTPLRAGDAWDRAQAVLEEAEPVACRRCGRRDAIKEWHDIEDARGIQRRRLYWVCRCGHRGYPCVQDFRNLREWYRSQGAGEEDDR